MFYNRFFQTLPIFSWLVQQIQTLTVGRANIAVFGWMRYNNEMFSHSAMFTILKENKKKSNIKEIHENDMLSICNFFVMNINSFWDFCLRGHNKEASMKRATHINQCCYTDSHLIYNNLKIIFIYFSLFLIIFINILELTNLALWIIYNDHTKKSYTRHLQLNEILQELYDMTGVFRMMHTCVQTCA